MRSHFKDIARQLIENKPGNKMNVIFGGGRDFLGASEENYHERVHFGGAAEVSCNRTDKVNLIKKYLEQFSNDSVVKYVKNLGELLDVLGEVHDLDHVLGLFANNHMSYNTLRNKGSDGEPSLTEMTKAAIKILGNKKNQNGFVLMVEGGKNEQDRLIKHRIIEIPQAKLITPTIRIMRDLPLRNLWSSRMPLKLQSR
jgi:alkaline phosphatase